MNCNCTYIILVISPLHYNCLAFLFLKSKIAWIFNSFNDSALPIISWACARSLFVAGCWCISSLSHLSSICLRCCFSPIMVLIKANQHSAFYCHLPITKSTAVELFPLSYNYSSSASTSSETSMSSSSSSIITRINYIRAQNLFRVFKNLTMRKFENSSRHLQFPTWWQVLSFEAIFWPSNKDLFLAAEDRYEERCKGIEGRRNWACFLSSNLKSHYIRREHA